MADAIRRSIRALPPRAAERRSAVRASGLLENAAREGRRHRSQHELHLRQGPGTVFQIRGGERAGGGDRVSQGAAQQSLRDLLRRNRRVCGNPRGEKSRAERARQQQRRHGARGEPVPHGAGRDSRAETRIHRGNWVIGRCW